MLLKMVKVLMITVVSAGLAVGCGEEAASADPTSNQTGGSDTSDTAAGSDGQTDTSTGSDTTDDTNTDSGNTDDGPSDNTELNDEDMTAADPNAAITLTGGNIRDCLPGLLESGEKSAYSGFAGSSYGAYFIWKDTWGESTLNFRIETWDSFGGVTGPGTYTIQERDTNYSDCGVCVFSESAEDGEFWLTEGSTINFTSLTTGSGGLGKALAGTIEGTFTNGLCVGTIEAEFGGISRNMDHGPL